MEKNKLSHKELYILIRCWEIEAGESFVEYFGDNYCGIKEDEVMQWMFEKGYIDIKKLELFKLEKHKSICDCFCGYEEEYSLFPNGECDEEAAFKAEIIIAEYLFEKDMQKVLTDFAYEGEGWASFDNEEDKKGYKEALDECISGWNDDDNDGFLNVLNLKIEDINARILEEQE